MEIMKNRIPPNHRPDKEPPIASIGATVTYTDSNGETRTFTLVPPGESKPQEGKISILSPIGQALLNRTVGEQIKVKIPAGEVEISIEKIS